MKRVFKFLVITLFLLSGSVMAEEADFSFYQKILDDHLKTCETGETAFDYAGAKANGETKVNFLKQGKILENFDLSTLVTDEERLAFWQNTYNFIILRFVVQNYDTDLKSIRDLGSIFESVFDKKPYQIAGQKRSFNDIEHGIVRPLAKTMFQGSRNNLYAARVHFAMNCASIGCPPFLPTAYEGARLNEQLDQVTKDALKISMHLSVDGANVTITQLFKWFTEDFVHDSGSIKAWLLRWAPEDKAAAVSGVQRDSDFYYHDYNWKLNKVRPGCE